MANIINYLTQAFLTPAQSHQIQPTEQVKKVVSTNPFSKNPFVNTASTELSMENYAKNKPVKGGYFAGYYNNKINIVGQRLFLEV